MINNPKKLRSISAVLASVYILYDLLLILCSALVFGEVSFTMLAGDAFGLIAGVILIAFTISQNEIKYKSLFIFPLVLGVGKIASVLPAVVSISTYTANAQNYMAWGLAAFTGIVYFALGAMYFTDRVTAKATAALYALPLITSFFSGDSTISHLGFLNRAAPVSVTLFQLLIRFSSVKGILILAAPALFTLSFAEQKTQSKAAQETPRTLTKQGVFITDGRLTFITSCIALTLAVLLAVLTFVRESAKFDLYGWEYIQNIWILKLASLVRAACFAAFSITGIFLAQKAGKAAAQTTAKRAFPLSVILIAAAEICYIIMFISVMDDSDGEGLGTLLLVFWAPIAIIFTAATFFFAILFSFSKQKISLVIVMIYFAIQLTAGLGNYLSVYPSIMSPVALAESIAVVVTLYFLTGLSLTPKAPQAPPSQNTTVYYNPNNNNN